VAGFNAKEISYPMLDCNNMVGFDGEILNEHDKLRNSKPAHISINMWVLNIFGEKDKPETLLKSIDVANLNLKFSVYDNAL